MRLLCGDGSPDPLEGRCEGFAEARVVVVVRKRDRDLAKAPVVDVLRERGALIRVGRGGPEYEVVVFELGDRRCGGGVRQGHHASRNVDRLHHAVRGPGAARPDDRHHLLDVDELRARVHRSLRVALGVAGDEHVAVAAEDASLFVHMGRRQVAAGQDGRHEPFDGPGDPRGGADLDVGRHRRGAACGEERRRSGEKFDVFHG